jgi:hypothetical protein
MSTIKSSITALASPLGKFIQPLDYDALPSTRQNGGFSRRFIAFIQEVWRRMGIMKADSERSGDGSLSRARSAERLRYEQAWSRKYDEADPMGRQPHQH